MKIISKYKDYYDYLVGKYGIDPKIVLDRREGYAVEKSKGKIVLYVCDKRYEGFCDGERYYWGDDLAKVGEFKRYWRDDGDGGLYHIKYSAYRPYSGYSETVTVKAEPYDSDLNVKYDCPIFIPSWTWDDKGNPMSIEKFPKLSDIGFAAVIPPDEMFRALTEWISARIQRNENVVDDRPDSLKIESKGFDKKRSFRPKMKA